MTGGAHLVIPLKPSSGSKQRLAGALGRPERELVSLSLGVRAVGLAARVWPRDRVVVVSAEHNLAPLCDRLGVARLGDSGWGQSAAVRSGACWCLERGATTIATIAADLPALAESDLRTLLATAEAAPPGSMTVFPDTGGTGTNGVIVNPASLLVHAFGPGSRRRHERIAAGLGLRFEVANVPGLQWDLDRPEDLQQAPESAAVGHPLVTWAADFQRAPADDRSRHVES